MTINSFKLIGAALLCFTMTACAGSKKVAEPTEPVADITRPPQMVSNDPQVAVEESNPDETISYDEWRKRREAELEAEKP